VEGHGFERCRRDPKKTRAARHQRAAAVYDTILSLQK